MRGCIGNIALMPSSELAHRLKTDDTMSMYVVEAPSLALLMMHSRVAREL